MPHSLTTARPSAATRLGALLASALVGLLLAGCLYVNIKTPLDTDLHKTTLGSKRGEASIHSILWLVAWGDAGTAAAARNGGLTTIQHMDTQIFSVLLGLYTRTTTIVYGD
jgi:hypothetical protein